MAKAQTCPVTDYGKTEQRKYTQRGSLRGQLVVLVALCFGFCLNQASATAPLVDSSLGVAPQLWRSTLQRLRIDLRKQRSTADYYDTNSIYWLTPHKTEFLPDPVRLKMINHVMPSPKRNVMDSYTTARSIKVVQDFLAQHEDAFAAAFAKHQVPPTVIAGILFLETGFNRPGIKMYPALATLVSLAALRDAKFRIEVLPHLIARAQAYDPSEKWRGEASRPAWDARAQEVGEQWFVELQAFLSLAKELKWTKAFALDIQSSWAGAIGFSQFLPATARRRLGQEPFDFWNWSDAIHLTAHELAAAGWAKDSDAALFAYNRVRWYRDIVMGVHQKTHRWWQKRHVQKLPERHVAK